jgi:uncharacterized Ntn-hydrolase superfamily protein
MSPLSCLFSTFSIVARCPRRNDFGVAVATARPFVGSAVPWVAGYGAIATQAKTNTELGRRALTLLSHGIPVRVAIEVLLTDDPERDHRQVHGVDRHGAFAYTGPACQPWCGDRAGDHSTVAGNLLAGPEVLEAMQAAFIGAEDQALAERLLRALEAGQIAGGDKRGKQSAALLVASDDPLPNHNLRVDDHADPVAELRRLHELALRFAETLREQYGPEGLKRYRRVKS